MNLLNLLSRKPRWHWRPAAGPPPPAVLAAAIAVLRRPGKRTASERAAVLAQLAELLDPAAKQQGRAAVALTAGALCSTDVLAAVAAAVEPDAHPSEPAIEAGALLATRMAAASPAAAAALATSGLVGSLVALLEAPVTQISPDAKLDVLAFFRKAAGRQRVREAMEEEGAAAAVVDTLAAAAAIGDWPLASEAAWALELMAGMSRRLTAAIGEAGGVEAALALLRAARQQQPASKELPRDEDATEAADTALHALMVLITDSRRNRVRLQRGGGAAELAEAFQDGWLSWESREQAVGMLQDLAAALLLDSAGEESSSMAIATPASSSGGTVGRARPAQQEWQDALLPSLVAVLQQRRGQHLQETKEAAAGVLAKFAANGTECAAAAWEAGAVPPLLQLLHVGSQLAGGERRVAIAALQALEPLVAQPGCQQELAEPCASASSQLDLLGLLRPLLASATAPELSLDAYPAPGSSGALDGGQMVAAGWHAAAVAARLCAGGSGTAQRLQDAVMARGLLPLLAKFVQADVPSPAAAVAAVEAQPATAGVAAGTRVQLMAIKCEVAGLLRSLAMRRTHHPALRACPGLLPCMHRLLLPGTDGWAELKAAARKVLVSLGELPDTARPLLTYSPQQLAALLREHGMEASAARLAEAGVTGAEFVRLGDAQLRELAAAGQLPRLLRVLQAYETFAEIDGCGARTGSLGLAKLATYLSNRGFRSAEVAVLAESLMELLDEEREDAVPFSAFLQVYDEFVARTMSDVQPPSKRRKTDSRMG